MVCWDGGAYHLKEDGNDIYCEFRGYRKAVTMFAFNVTDIEFPLSGNGVVTNETKRVISFSDNLWLDPLPYEYLFTAHTSPQIKVKVKGVPGVCNGNCDYNYVEMASEVT